MEWQKERGDNYQAPDRFAETKCNSTNFKNTNFVAW